jgi:hypothetical protein
MNGHSSLLSVLVRTMVGKSFRPDTRAGPAVYVSLSSRMTNHAYWHPGRYGVTHGKPWSGPVAQVVRAHA